MFEFFDQVVGFFEVIWTMIQNFINSLIMILGTVVAIPGVIAELAFFLPAVIFTGVTVTISFAVVKFLIGR